MRALDNLSELKTCCKGVRGRSEAQVSFLGYAASMTGKGPAKGYSTQRLPTRTLESSWTDLGSNIAISKTGKCATSWEMWVARMSQRPTVGRCAMGTAFLRRQKWLG